MNLYLSSLPAVFKHMRTSLSSQKLEMALMLPKFVVLTLIIVEDEIGAELQPCQYFISILEI